MVFILVHIALLNGCAIHYFDPETGIEHLWGIGHMRMKVGEANEGVRAVVVGTDTLGMAAGSTVYDRYVALGWQTPFSTSGCWSRHSGSVGVADLRFIFSEGRK